MTKKAYTSRVGPVISAISNRAGQPMPLRRRRPTGDGATGAPPPIVVTPAGGTCVSCPLSRSEMVMTGGSLSLLGRALDRVDDPLGIALTGQQVDHGGVERVADVLAVDRVEPLRHERGLGEGRHDRLQVRLGNHGLRLAVHRWRVEGGVEVLLHLRGREVVEEGGALDLRGLGRAGEAVDAT